MHDTENLILLIKKEECLWNIHSELFLHKQLKVEAWVRIAEAMLPKSNEFKAEDIVKMVPDLKKRWTHIKDYYRKEKRAKKEYYSVRKAEYVYRRKYVFYDLLQFLDPILNTSRRAAILRLKTNIRDKTKGNRKKRSNSPPEGEISEARTETHESTDQLEISQSRHYIPDCLLGDSSCETSQPNQETTEQRQATTNNLGTNPNVAFLLSCAHDMQEMNPYQRIEFRAGIVNLLRQIKYPVQIKTT